MKILLPSLLVALSIATGGAQDQPPQLTPEQIQELLGKMTLEDMFKQNQCEPAKCEQSNMTLVPHYAKTEFESNGCMGLNNGNIKIEHKNEIDSTPFESCCDQYHACLQVCGVKKDVCDNEFAKCSMDKCDLRDDKCMKHASLFGSMAKTQPCEFFEAMQKSSCMCVDPKKASEWKVQGLKAFYQKYAPENRVKVAGLIEKATTQSKTAALWRKLIAKYPESIKIVETIETNKMKASLEEEGWVPDPDRPGWFEKDGKYKTHMSLDDHWTQEEQEEFRKEQDENFYKTKMKKFGYDLDDEEAYQKVKELEEKKAQLAKESKEKRKKLAEQRKKRQAEEAAEKEKAEAEGNN